MGHRFSILGLVVLVLCGDLGAEVLDLREAPRGTPWPATWAAGNKDFISAAFEERDLEGAYSSQSPTSPVSKLWMTAAEGVVSEVYWPTLDRKQIRDWQFLISDSESFFVEERVDSKKRVEWLKPGVPAFVVESRDPLGRFLLKKTYFVDPDRNTVLCELLLSNFTDRPLKAYSLVNPAMANTPYGDSARALGPDLFATQERDWLYHGAFPSFVKSSVGHSGSQDPFQDVRNDLRHDAPYNRATDGNVVLMGELPETAASSTRRFVLSLAFGDTAQIAKRQGVGGLQNYESALTKFEKQWSAALERLPVLGTNAQEIKLARASYSVLRMLEDRTFEGAFIASPSVPWGLLKRDDSFEFSPRHVSKTSFAPEEKDRAKGIGAYHLVWPRDLYQMAQSFLAVDDVASAVAAMRYLKGLQFGPEDGVWNYGPRQIPKAGAFVQNAWLHGESYWRMLQIDQVAYPVILASQLIELGAINELELRNMVLSAADFLEEFGPWSFQERWEENSGVTPSGLSVQIRALRLASDLARSWNEELRADRYGKKAAQLDSFIEEWTFTRSGTVGDGNYFLRVVGSSSMTAPWNPNSWARIRITNGGDWLLEKEVIDGGFLELVRNGIRSATDFFVSESLEEYDLQLRKDILGRSGFTRYTGDRYNWDESTGMQTNGMPWPFLTGERAIFEMQKAQELPSPQSHFDDVVAPLMRDFSSFASDSLMFPEQVWDSGDRAGQGSGAATPLGWAHGEYLQMLKSSQDFRQSLDSDSLR